MKPLLMQSIHPLEPVIKGYYEKLEKLEKTFTKLLNKRAQKCLWIIKCKKQVTLAIASCKTCNKQEIYY